MIKYMNAIIICGPSGSGKSTIVRRLISECSDKLGYSVSHTSRKQRPGELEGREYHFVSREKFESMVQSGEFIEHAQYSDNFYGTSRMALDTLQQQGKTCIIEIEVEGVKQIRQRKDINGFFIFIKPPSMEELETRLVARGTETDDVIRKRLARARVEIDFADHSDNVFDLQLVNENLEKAYTTVKNSIMSFLN